MTSLLDYREDIQSLETEIRQLESQYEEKLAKFERFKREGRGLRLQSEIGQVVSEKGQEATTAAGETIDITPPRSGRYNPYDDVVIPPPAEHEFFDASIMEFFDSKSLMGRSAKRHTSDIDTQADEDKLEAEILQHINLENLYRLNGVTAFAINNKSINEQTTSQDLHQLGLRFDLFNPKDDKFLQPHYIILQKDEKNDGWKIFKKTIPLYIDLDVKWLNIDLYKFTSDVRRQLLKANQLDQLIN